MAYIEMMDTFLYVLEGNIYSINLETNISREIKMKNSKTEGANWAVQIKKIKDDKCILLYEDFSVWILRTEDSKPKRNSVGCVCPFCVSLYSAHKTTFASHLAMHSEAGKCTKCKVSVKFTLKTILKSALG